LRAQRKSKYKCLKIDQDNDIAPIVEHSDKIVYDLVVVGGGAAGFFGAIQAAEMRQGLKILILEKSNKVLSKVRISGGGRCNVTHACFNPIKLSHHYPRGEKQMQQVFKTYDTTQVIEWFKAKGVLLKEEEDGRMFPVSDSSQTIIDCFMKEALRLKIKIEMGEAVARVGLDKKTFEISCLSGKQIFTNNILVATGGSPNIQSYDWIAALGHKVIRPIPSLFTFNDSEKKFQDLMGVSAQNAEIKIAGTKFSETGPILITHWGLSGPAVIKLSAWAAQHLHQVNYNFTVLVSWIGPVKEQELRDQLTAYKNTRVKLKIVTNPLFSIPQRLWSRLCELASIAQDKTWGELPQKNMNRLMEFIMRCAFEIKGKTTFKEEFVTCGGVDLAEVNLQTMESKKTQNVYFAGEVLNVDGETGGFNFQAAWSTSYVVAKSITTKTQTI
jgi:predicted Rossmann fold flavoprotein